jgi:hypothetical protein
MRLSLLKAAHAILFGSCEQEIRGSEAVALSAPEVKMLPCAAAENQ